MVIDVLVKQALLRSVLPDGTVVMLVVLHDDRCAIVRNHETVHEAAGDADGIDGAVQRFMAMTQVSDVLGDGARDADNGGASAMRSEITRDAAASTSPPTSLTPPAAVPRPSL